MGSSLPDERPNAAVDQGFPVRHLYKKNIYSVSVSVSIIYLDSHNQTHEVFIINKSGESKFYIKIADMWYTSLSRYNLYSFEYFLWTVVNKFIFIVWCFIALLLPMCLYNFGTKQTIRKKL